MNLADDEELSIQGDVRGKVVVGQTLTADTSGITDGNGLGEFSYRWLRDGTDTVHRGSTYTLGESEAGRRISVRVTFTDGIGNRETRTSPRTSRATMPIRKLVGTGRGGSVEFGLNNVDENRRAWSQGFLTGANEQGYMIESFRVGVDVYDGDLGPEDQVIKLFEANNNYLPIVSSEVATLSSLGSFPRGVRNWTGSSYASGVKLEKETRYAFAAIENSATSRFVCFGNNRIALASDGLSGWNMGRKIELLLDDFSTPTPVLSFGFRCRMSVYGRELKSDAAYLKVLALTNTPAGNFGYTPGETIEVTATFSAPVTGTLVLPVRIGDDTLALTATGIANTTFVFRHVVGADDLDADGFSYEANALYGYVDAELGHAVLRADDGNRVNDAPEVRSVRVTSTPAAPSWYLAGETIEITVQFDRDIAVTGDPTFGFFLDNGSPSGPRSAVYDSGRSDSDNMVFTYTVTAADDDNDGIFIGAGPGTFELDSDDAIKDGWRPGADKLDANLSHSRPGRRSAHRVSQRARIKSMSITSTPLRGTDMDTYGLGDQIKFQATFNRDVAGDRHAAGAHRDRFGRPSNLNTATTWASYDAADSGGAVIAFSYTVQASDLDDNGIFITEHTGSIVLFRLRGGATVRDTRTGGAAADAVLGYPRDARIGGPNSNHKVNGGIVPPPNVRATGAPVIVGGALRGVTLDADTSGISDGNGLSSSNFAYQWFRTLNGVDTEISGATGATYLLTRQDLGHTVKVRVDFIDDDGYVELLASAVTAVVIAHTETSGIARVPPNWPLIPPESNLGAGDRFRLMFVTADPNEARADRKPWDLTDATSTNIADYNEFVQLAALNGHRAVRDYAGHFRALASTAAVNARVNTATTASDTDTRIFWLAHRGVADDSLAEFYDSTRWKKVGNQQDADGNPAPMDLGDLIWTGTNTNGTTSSAPLGAASATVAEPNLQFGWMDNGETPSTTIEFALYALSMVFEVAAAGSPVEVGVSFGGSGYTATEGGDAALVTVTLSHPPLAAVDIPLSVTANGGADVSDYSGIPARLRFGVSQTSQTFTVTATDDSDDDDGESVTIGFGNLPSGFAAGAGDGQARPRAAGHRGHSADRDAARRGDRHGLRGDTGVRALRQVGHLQELHGDRLRGQRRFGREPDDRLRRPARRLRPRRRSQHHNEPDRQRHARILRRRILLRHRGWDRDGRDGDARQRAGGSRGHSADRDAQQRRGRQRLFGDSGKPALRRVPDEPDLYPDRDRRQ